MIGYDVHPGVETSQGNNATPDRAVPGTARRQPLSFGRIFNRVLERIASRNAAGYIGKAHPIARAFVLVHQRDIAGHVCYRRSANPACR